MERIFGFDIGTTSIGWAVINHDRGREEGRILGMGVRIFPEARDPDGTPLNQTRRQKRLVRRQLRRRRQRRKALNELLAGAGLLPPFSRGKRVNGKYEKSAWEEAMTSEPLALRAKGLADRLEHYELGRALYHLAQRRHFKGRDIEESDKPEEEALDEKAAKSAREQMVGALKASGQTLGQMLAERSPRLGDRTNRISIPRGEIPAHRTRGVHALRSNVEDEFEKLAKAQEEHHPVLTEIRDGLRETIFSQKPVFWRKNTLGQCRFVPGEPLCPKGSWLSQQRRMLEKLNNLAIAGGNMRPLDDEERAAILGKLQTQASMSWAGVRAALRPIYKARGEPGEEKTLRFNLELGGESKLIGNAVEAKLADIFDTKWEDHPHKQAIRDCVQERLWKADYGEIGEQRVVILPAGERAARRAAASTSFIRDFGVAPDDAGALRELKLPAGWEPYSTKALREFLPHLQAGVRFGALVSGPEWAEWRAQTFPDRGQPTGEILDRLPSPANMEEQKRLAAIRNPTVARTQNELRKVVNNLIGAYGKPDLIRVELAREVGKSKRQREDDQKRNRANEKQRKTAADNLRANGIEPSRRDIEKWALWKESQERCPYSGDQIGFDALFRTGDYEVEHIWPRSSSFDSSFANLTLCRRDLNIAKAKRTPFAAFGTTPDWEVMRDRVWKWVKDKHFPIGKAKRFCRTEPLDDEFKQRQLNDTGYAARETLAFLKRLWPDVGPEAPVTVEAVTGRVTAQLRRLWELNNILSDDGEKTRADHRHHAIDALVVACTHQGLTKRLSDHWQLKDEDARGERPQLPTPWIGIRAEAERMRDSGEIKISHRVRKKVSGPLHGEMPFGNTGDEEVKNGTSFGVFVKKMPVEKLSLATLKIDHVSQTTRTEKFVVRDKAVREALASHLSNAGGDPKKAYPPWPRLTANGSEIRKVRVLSLQQKNLMASVAMQANDGSEREPSGFADLGNNHHISIYRLADGSADFEIVSLYEASRRLAKREPVICRKGQDGAEFVMSFASGEAIEFLNGDKKGIWIVQGAWSNGQVVLTRDHDARPTSKKEAARLGMDGPREEYRPKVFTLLSDNVRKVSVDPIGRVRPAND